MSASTRPGRPIAEDPDINVVSVAVANFLHREIVEGLVAAGKHVLCEKPLSDNLEDARAMADLARGANTVVASASPSAERRAQLPNHDFEPRRYSLSPIYEAQSVSAGLKVGEE